MIFFKKKLSSILLISLCSLNCCTNEKEKPSFESLKSKIAILGDDLSTGAGAHVKLSFTPEYLISIITGKKRLEVKAKEQNLNHSPLIRLWPNYREYESSLDWLSKNIIHSLSSLFFDLEEHSWGIQLAKKIGYNPEDVIIAADNKAKITDLTKQTSKLLSYTKGYLPEKIFIFFSMSNLCESSKEFLIKQDKFKSELTKGIKLLLSSAKSPKEETKIYIVGFLGLTQIITDPINLKKEVEAYGQVTHCQELRRRYFQPPQEELEKEAPKLEKASYILNFFPPNPSSLCPTLHAQDYIVASRIGLFNSWDQDKKNKIIKKESSELTSLLANKIRQYRKAAFSATHEIKQKIKANKKYKHLKIKYISTDKFQIEPQDIAPNCFHLSREGHRKLADLIKDQLN